MDSRSLEILIHWCGVGHFALCAGSLAIPTILRWRESLQSLQPLLKQMFWTYAVYIFLINLFFGLVSVFGPMELLNGSFLARSVTLFISAYWFGRILVQFFYFDRSHAPNGIIFRVGEIALVGLFALFAISYGAAFFFNIL